MPLGKISEPRRNVNLATPVVVLLDNFLDWVQGNRAERTYEWYQRHLQPFALHIGRKRKIAELRPHHVTEYIAARHPSSSNDHNSHGKHPGDPTSLQLGCEARLPSSKSHRQH